jgi:cytochrome c2
MKYLIIMITLLMTSFNSFAYDAEKAWKTNCATCHTIGNGDKIGPDLAELSKRRTVDWVVKFVNYPDGMINGDEEESGYEKADPMAKKVYELYKPTLMAEQEMTKEEVKKMMDYIDSFKKKAKGKINQLK